MKCDVDIRKVLFTSAMLAKARPCFNGFLFERVTKELTTLAPSTMDFQVATRVSR